MAESKLERDIMDLKKEIDVIMDFPKEGISFKDITTLLRNKDSFKEAVRALAEPLRDEKIAVSYTHLTLPTTPYV